MISKGMERAKALVLLKDERKFIMGLKPIKKPEREKDNQSDVLNSVGFFDRLLIVNAVSMHRQATPYLGYESLLGLPVLVFSGILIHKSGADSGDSNIGVVVMVMVFVFLFGMRMLVKTMEQLALSRYPRTIKRQISGISGKPTDKLFWKWILIYYTTTAAICALLAL